MKRLASMIMTVALVHGVTLAQEAPSVRRFDFGAGLAMGRHTRVLPEMTYDAQRGFGFEPGASVHASGQGCVSEQPFLFSVALPEGNYNVTLTLGGTDQPSTMMVKAECRRLMLEGVQIDAGRTVTRSFTVNVRNATLPDGGHVAINERDRERQALTWDDRLTLEFNGVRPAVCAIEIAPAPEATTVFVAGDSTVTDQGQEPWAGWGQMLPRFFGPGVAVANHAESGRALRSFAAERRFDKVISQLQRGDYVLIQFGHNDMKEKGEGIGPFTSYKASLHEYITRIVERGGRPVLITSMHRRHFHPDVTIKNTFGDYPAAMRQAAAEANVPLIDLHAMSQQFYEALGVDGSTRAFVHYPADTFPNQPKPLMDNSHHNAYGAYELARCVIEGIKANVPDLAAHLVDTPTYDPSHPTPPDAFEWYATPPRELATPEGN